MTRFDWNFTTVPQKGLNDRAVTLQRGRILGGTSAVSEYYGTKSCRKDIDSSITTLHSDGMIYSRGSASDFDRFASVSEDPGWSWDRLQPYFMKVTNISLFDVAATNWAHAAARTRNLKLPLIITTQKVNSILRYTVLRERCL